MKCLNKLTCVLILSLTMLSGCSAYGVWFGETKPMLTFAELKSDGVTTNSPMKSETKQQNRNISKDDKSSGNASRLFVWSPKNTAAFVNSEGKGCVQGAEVFHEKSGKVDISNELLGILKGIDLSGSSSAEKGLAIELTNDILTLRANTERNTYLSIGMFGLCQLQANGGLTSSEVLALTVELLNSSLNVGVNKPTLPK